ncbi:fumarylacetoacetate hydrolase family protein [Citricoccus sp. NR2]|uniref:fumarylacetoacetate hydrolase family protein n=1 Tax=Citricoccus sp. NR2 TaxID=3004095 RepID=UPI0022DE8776|nr:fumarylacetoacetate hydrolase family protein [Citricoccus sp. NR2]WBL19568.1 fumarylacetoacetate hydrolase family protein [Citricoccus sp. NR2]
MKLATIRTPQGTAAARYDQGKWTLVDGYSDVGQLLLAKNWLRTAQNASGSSIPEEDAQLDSPIPAPGKIICVGLNYASHIKEMGRELPTHPTLFAKFAETLTGPFEPITAVAEDPELDWEGELVVVIGKRADRVTEEEARDAIAGYSSANDISMRGWQFRTIEWLQGKIWARSTPIGPVVVTHDEFDYKNSTLRTRVNGEVMQEHSTGDLVFTPEHLVAYISTMLPLNPGDLILTGTPGGVGRARDPQVFLKPGDVVEVEIDGIGPMRSKIVAP